MIGTELCQLPIFPHDSFLIGAPEEQLHNHTHHFYQSIYLQNYWITIMLVFLGGLTDFLLLLSRCPILEDLKLFYVDFQCMEAYVILREF